MNCYINCNRPECSPEDYSATLLLEFVLLRSSACCSANCGWKISPGSSVVIFPLWVNHELPYIYPFSQVVLSSYITSGKDYLYLLN